MKVEKVDHIHIWVKDYEKAIKFFTDTLETKFGNDICNEPYDSISAIDPYGLEVIGSTSPNGPVAKAMEKRGEGLAAISFKVADLEEAIKDLESRGLRLVNKFEVCRMKEAQFHPKDSYGVMIELCEYEDEHGASAAAQGK